MLDFEAWILLTRDTAVSCWVAHCLDLDVVTQGATAEHALEMVQEAVEMVVKDDLAAGRDPLSRRAPPAYWTMLDAILLVGEEAYRTANQCDVRVAKMRVVPNSLS